MARLAEPGDNTEEVIAVPLEVIDNTMNNMDQERLLKYLEPQFIDAKPDDKTITAYQLELASKEGMDVENEDEISTDLPGAEPLIPREYQYELFQKALKENIIAVLSTGSGKTLIAVMLIKTMNIQEHEERLVRRKTKHTFFLVHHVPLVFQQASVIRNNCDVTVQQLCGNMDVDSWSEKRWKAVFDENDVCVMTAQVFLNALRHGFISMDRVNLLIFDEAHHTAKNHPYNLILREFYDRCPKEDKPKIFGMTASPTKVNASVELSVKNLEQNLDAYCVTATKLSELESVMQRPREVTVTFDTSPAYDQTPLEQIIREAMGSNERFQRCLVFAKYTLDVLGPWCCDALLRHLLTRMGVNISNKDDIPNMLMQLNVDAALGDAYIRAFDTYPHSLSMSYDTRLFSPKVRKLITILYTLRHRKDLSAIIFVDRRHTAVVLSLLIKACDFLSHINCAPLTGHGTKDDGDIHMRLNEQNQVIDDFRSQKLNLLVATSVAEEGLDIKACNVVIRFDMCLTPTSYIQSRGRTRHENSVYVIFIPQDNIELQSRLNEYRILEQNLLEFCRTAPKDRNVTYNFSYGVDEYAEEDSPGLDEYDSDEDDNDFVESLYMVPTTGAIVTKNSAVSLVCRFCGALPSDSFCVLKPIFELFPAPGGFTCTLRLPSNSPVTEVSSEFSRSKNGAKQLAALAACQQLHSLGALDDHLLPKVQSKEYTGEMVPELDDNGLAFGSRRRKCIYEKRTPKFWERLIEVEEGKEEGEDEDEDEVVHSVARVEASGATEFQEPANEEDVESNGEQKVEPDSARAETVSTSSSAVVCLKNQDTSIPDTPVPDMALSPQSSPLAKEESLLSENSKVAQLINPSELPIQSLETEHLVINGDIPPITENLGDLTAPLVPADSTDKSTTDGAKDSSDETAEDSKEKAEEETASEEPLDEGPFITWMSLIDVKLEGGMLDDVPVRRLCMFTWKEFPMLPTFELYVNDSPIYVTVQPLPHTFSFDKEQIQLLADFGLKVTSSITNKDFTCPVRDIPYFLAPLKRDCKLQSTDFETPDISLAHVDWDEIFCGVNNKTIPLQFDEPSAFDDAILIDYADSRRYFVNEICYNLSPTSPVPDIENIREAGHESFAAYYEETFKIQVEHPNQPMVHVRKTKKITNYLQANVGMKATEKGRIATYVIPEFCTRFSISASVYQAVRIIPSIMTRLDSFLLACEARERYDLPIEDTLMLEAFTTPSASMAMNYERLETLGDSLLKFIATIRLFINFPLDNEGELHYLRIRVICNKALYRAAKQLKIYRYVTSQAFNRRHWRPHHFVAKADTIDTLKETKRHMLSDKTLADIVEALLGAAYLSSGLEGGLHCAIQMLIPFDEIKVWGDFLPTFIQSRTKVPPRAEVSALRNLNISRMETITGYRFKTPLLMIEALTHASLPNSTVPCYQRLEFLGDAILDFLVIRYLFKKYPEAPPGIITDLKGACVNNHVLGIVCLEVELHMHIIHYSGKLIGAINDCREKVTKMKEDGEAVGEYWGDLSIPKVLSDVVESMLGAVFVDAGFDLEPVEALFQRWFLPIFDNHVTPELIRVHPLSKFTTMLQREGCEGYLLRNHTSTRTDMTSQKCVIFLHEQPLACGASDSIKGARRDAARKALERMEEEPDLLERVCNCGSLRQHRNALKKEQAESSDEEEYIS